MTTEREMLEYIAKACGSDAVWFDELSAFVANDTPNPTWNPLTDSADCAAMCAKLMIDTNWNSSSVLCSTVYYGDDSECVENFKDHNNDREAAWRYAATMVAAAKDREEETLCLG